MCLLAVSVNRVGAMAWRGCEQRPERIEVGSVRVVPCGVPAAVGGKVLGRGATEGLHEGAKPADQGVDCIDVVAARGALRAPSSVQREVRDMLVLRDPLVGDEPVRAEHRVRRHHGQQRGGDRRLASVRDGLEGSVAGSVSCREELLLPGLPAPRRRCRRTVPAPIGPPPQARRRRVVRRVAPVPDPLARPLSALALVGFVGLDDSGKAVFSLRR